MTHASTSEMLDWMKSLIGELNGELLAAYTMIGTLRADVEIATIRRSHDETGALDHLLAEIPRVIAKFDVEVAAIRKSSVVNEVLE